MAIHRLKKCWMAKLKALKECKEQYDEISKGVENITKQYINTPS